MTPYSMDRRSGQEDPPTVALVAVRSMAPWQKNVLFVLGVLGVIGEAVWFFLSPYERRNVELIAGAVLLVAWFWCLAPEWTTRQLDKYAPSFLRVDRRKDRS